ncbi:MAG: hypothetical protein QGD94_04840 [Planctomycetia bacterium]|nr:hypothetical protein [Planctomycetia bacterium]
MSRKAAVAVAVMVLVLAAGCKEFNRQNYAAISTGMNQTEVLNILGEPTERFTNVFIYLEKNPMGNAEAHIYFDANGKVVGKTYEDPAKPQDNSREGIIPK